MRGDLPEPLDRRARRRVPLRERAEDERARPCRAGEQRFGGLDRIPRHRLADLVRAVAALVDVHADESGRQRVVHLDQIRSDAVARRASQHLFSQPVVADAAHHRHGRPRRAQVAGDVERRAAEEEPFGE